MTIEQEKVREDLAVHLNRAPFRPFAVSFRDGARFEIVRRFQAGIGLSKGYLVSADEKSRRNFHIGDIISIQDLNIA